MEPYQYSEWSFSKTTFEYLADLDDNFQQLSLSALEQEYYITNYDDFIEEVEQPFQEFCHLV